MKSLLQKGWKWSWAVTLPVSIVFLVWTWNTETRYWDFQVRYDCAPFSPTLFKVGRMEFQHMMAKTWDSIRSHVSDRRPALPTVDLLISEENINRLDQNLPHSGREYQKARMLYPDGEIENVKVKYRGDFAGHWGHYKKSLRIKTKKDRLLNGLRMINLVIPKFPEQMNNYLCYQLSDSLGLVTPASQMVNVRINGSNRGTHVLTEQIEEMTLRRNSRMPGDLYAGEIVGRDTYTGITENLFHHPRSWTKLAVNNHYPADSYAPLETLIDRMYDDTDDGQRKMLEMLDLRKWADFSVLEILTQTIHYDRKHNWRLFYDPARFVFEPAVWDPTGWHPVWREMFKDHPKLDIMTSELQEALLRNQAFLFARYCAMEDFFTSGNDKHFFEVTDETADALLKVIPHDMDITRNFEYLPPSKAEAAVREFRGYVRSLFRKIEQAYLFDSPPVRCARLESGALALQIDGRLPVRSVQLTYSQPPESVKSATVSYWRRGTNETVDVTGAVSVKGNMVVIAVPLMARYIPVMAGNLRVSPLTSLETRPAYYEIKLGGSVNAADAIDIAVERRLSDMEDVEMADTLEKTGFDRETCIVNPAPLLPPVVWAGEVSITNTLHLDRDLIIEKGTTVRLSEGASILTKSKVRAEGTESDPIRFIPVSEEQAPWGCLALQGPGANGSRFTHCIFEGGSGFKTPLQEYSAMLSMHDLKDARIKGCSFRNSRIVDDMVRGVYSNIEFEDCTFENSLSDAVDLDICKAVFKHCSFLGAGNDALDLMSSRALIEDSLMKNSGDKGVSVGENTRAFIRNCVITGNVIGVQAKDQSHAMLVNVDLTGNGTALDAYKKNWRYGGGGHIAIYFSHVSDNESSFSADSHSAVSIFNSFTDQPVPEKNNIYVDELTDSRSPTTAAPAGEVAQPEELSIEFYGSAWSDVSQERRGAHGVTD
ncbi:MAG: CotH kinase family protein [Verrucomicrobia bacterium]|nr:CotH kinase family protein [Verrucomicrobiota bacterium]